MIFFAVPNKFMTLCVMTADIIVKNIQGKILCTIINVSETR